MSRKARIEELEEQQNSLSVELEAIEEELEQLKADERKDELSEWAKQHGLSYEQTQIIPCTQAIQDYFSSRVYSRRSDWLVGTFCNASFAMPTGLYCRWKAPDWGECSDLIPTELILDALKVSAK